jgi:DNA-binding transcriptional MerR regulator
MKFTVGEMARLNNMSAQTLRYYDKIDLFKPSQVDERTGYRYYKVSQFQTLQMIKYLKFLGTPLEEIKEFICDINIEKTLEFLDRQSTAIDDKIKQLEKIKKNVDANITYISKYMNLEDYEAVNIEEMGPFHVIESRLGRRLIESGQWDVEITKLLNINEDEVLYFSGDIGVSVDMDDISTGSFTLYKSIFYFCNDDDKKLKNFVTYPRRLYARTVHKGDFLETSKAYERIFSFVEENSLVIDGDAIEINVIDELISKCEDEYYLDISIPVRKKDR